MVNGYHIHNSNNNNNDNTNTTTAYQLPILILVIIIICDAEQTRREVNKQYQLHLIRILIQLDKTSLVNMCNMCINIHNDI